MKQLGAVCIAGVLALALGGCESMARFEPVSGKAQSRAAARKPAVPKQALSLAAAAPRQPARADADKALSREEIEALLVDNSVYAGAGGLEFAAFHYGDGSLKGKSWSGAGTETGSGSWKVETDGSYCRKWDNSWAAGQWGCFRVYRKGGELAMVHVSGSGATGDMTLVPGNAYGL